MNLTPPPTSHPSDHGYKVRSSTSPAKSRGAGRKSRSNFQRPLPDSPPHFPPELPYPPNPRPMNEPFYENTSSVQDHDVNDPPSTSPSSNISQIQPIPLPVSPANTNPNPNNNPSPSIAATIHYDPPISPNLSPHPLTPPSHDTEGSPPLLPPVEDPLPHWSTTNSKRARFHTVCPACHEEIKIGDRISYQFQYRRFVHEGCASVECTRPQYTPPPHPNPPQAAAPGEDPLAPGSFLDELPPEYRSEVVRWVQFHSDYPRIPGIHEDFSERTLQNYLRYRSETCRDLSVICSKLKMMGGKCGFVLCTSKHQQPSLQYQRLRSCKLAINKTRREAGRDADTNEALGTGNLAITMVLSGYDVRSARRCRPLHALVREFITIHVMLHGGCLRFGIFRYTDILREQLEFSAIDNCHLLRTTWRKTKKSNRPYSIKFPCRPDAGNPARYVIPGTRGPTYTSVGTVITWYLQASNLLNAPGHALLFPRSAEISDRRGAFTRWLQATYAALLPPGSNIPRRIRPHSGRAGWATDRARQNANAHTIMLEGRWSDPRAMRRYIRTSLRDLVTSARHRALPQEMKKNPFRRRK